MEWINIGKIAEEHKCYSEYDDEYQCQVLDEEKVVKVLKKKLKKGGLIVDYHGCDFFPEDLFDAVFVLRSATDVLHDRLVARNYSGKKLEDNQQSEIFQIILDEAREYFGEDMVFELQNNKTEDIDKNCQCIVDWMKDWLSNKENL